MMRRSDLILNWGDIQDNIFMEKELWMFSSRLGKAMFGKTMKKAAKKGAEKAVTAAATKTGEHVGKKADDKIVKMLSKSSDKPKKITFKPVPKITQEEIDNKFFKRWKNSQDKNYIIIKVK